MHHKTSVNEIEWCEIFDYQNGFLFWKEDQKGQVKAGDIAGSLSHGYVHVCYDQEFYAAHHIVWVMHGNTVPEGLEIDHRDRNKLNNEISNLRLASRAQNNANSRVRNRFGVKGVYLNAKSGKYQVQFTIAGKKKSLGYFENLEDARATAIEFHKAFYGEFSNV